MRRTAPAAVIAAVMALAVVMSWKEAAAANPINRARKVARAVDRNVARDAAAAKQADGSATEPAVQAKPAESTPTVRPASQPIAVKPAPVKVSVPSAPQEERVVYHYNALGRRDPFQPLVGGGFVGMDVGGDAPPDAGGIKVVGIVWGTADKFALVEDPRGNSLVLRQGDKVMNGVVESLKRDAVVLKLNLDGVSQTLTIPVTRKGEQNVNN